MWLLRKLRIKTILGTVLFSLVLTLIMDTVFREFKYTTKSSANRQNFLPQSDTAQETPRKVLAIGYQRCGSSLIGLLFNSNPNAFFVFEPDDGVYSALYGTANGWNVPTDIFNFWNGSYRQIPEVEIDALSTTLHNLLTCNVRKIPTEVLAHNFMFQWRKRQSKVHPFLNCLGANKVRIYDCRLHLKGLCPRRFGENMEKHDKCRTLLWDVRAHPSDYNMTNLASVMNKTSQYFKSRTLLGQRTAITISHFKSYHSCMSEMTKKMQPCFPVLENTCNNASIRSVKTVRVTMETVSSLLERTPDLRTVHIMRDPRPVALSRQKQPSFHGRYSGKDIALEAKFYCQRAIQDTSIRRHLAINRPESFHQIIYEDLSNHPVLKMEELYRFLRSDVPTELREWVMKNTQENRNSSSISTSWMPHMSYDLAYNISRVCKGFEQAVNYEWP